MFTDTSPCRNLIVFLQLLTYFWFIYPKLLWHSNLYSKFHFETFCTSQKSYRPISRTPWLWVVGPTLRTPVVDTLWSQYVFLILTVCWDSVSTQSLWVTLSSIKTSWNQDHIWGKLMSNWHHYRSIKRDRIYSYLFHVDLTVAKKVIQVWNDMKVCKWQMMNF